MTWTYGASELGKFTLKGSRRAFDEVLECQRAHQATAENPQTPVSAAAEGSQVAD